MSAVGQGDENPREGDEDDPVVNVTDTEDGILLWDEENPVAWIEVEGEKGVAYLDVGP